MEIIFFLFFGRAVRGFRDLSSRTRDRTHGPAVETQSPNHWTTRDFPGDNFLCCIYILQDFTVSFVLIPCLSKYLLVSNLVI